MSRKPHVKLVDNQVYFENKLPQKAFIQFSKSAAIKNFLMVFFAIVATAIFGYFVGKERSLLSTHDNVVMESLIMGYGFTLYILVTGYVFFTRKVKFEMSWTETALIIASSLVLIAGTLIFNMGILGENEDGYKHSSDVAATIKLLSFVFAGGFGFVAIVNLVTTLMVRSKYKRPTPKAIFGMIGVLVSLAAPFVISDFEAKFEIKENIPFLALLLGGILVFTTAYAALTKLQPSESRLLSFNKVRNTLILSLGFGPLLGITLNAFMQLDNKADMQLIMIIGAGVGLLSLAFLLTLVFLSTRTSKLYKTNSVRNKVIFQVFILVNLITSIFLVYLAPKIVELGNSRYDGMISGITIPVAAILIGTLIVSATKFVTFERWEAVAYIVSLFTSGAVVALSFAFYILEDAQQIKQIVGRTVWMVYLLIYILGNAIILIPVAISSLGTKKPKKTEQQKVGN